MKLWLNQQTVDALRQEWLKREKPESGFDKWLEENIEIYEPLIEE